MKLCPPVVNLVKEFVNACPDFEYRVASFKGPGLYAYHPSKLVRKNRISKDTADFASAFLNVWKEELDALPVPENERKRLNMCMFSYSAVSKYTSTCNHKLCPICRAIQMLQVQKILDHMGPLTAAADGYWVNSDPYKMTRDRRSVLNLRNVLFRNGHFFVKVLGFRPAKPGKAEQPEDLRRKAFELLCYDFGLLNQHNLLKTWVELVKNSKMITRKHL